MIILGSRVDSAIKAAVEQEAARLTGSTVTIKDVDFSLFSGKGLLTGLMVGNPEGFSGSPALTLGKIQFEMDLSTFSMGLRSIREIRADLTEGLVEKNQKGQINFQVFSEKLRRTKGKEAPQNSNTDTWKHDLRIAEFVLSEGNVTLSGFKEASSNVSTPELRLQNLGWPDGAPPDKLGEEILAGIFTEIIRISVQSELQKWIEGNTDIPGALKNLLNQGLGSVN